MYVIKVIPIICEGIVFNNNEMWIKVYIQFTITGTETYKSELIKLPFLSYQILKMLYYIFQVFSYFHSYSAVLHRLW